MIRQLLQKVYQKLLIYCQAAHRSHQKGPKLEMGARGTGRF